MAAFLPILGDLSGRIGDNVFAKNAKSSYVRRGTKPVNTITARRTQVRTAFQFSSDAWVKDIDESERLTWDDYATNTPVTGKFGLQRNRTGRDWFMAINTFLLNATLPVQLLAPQTPGTGAGWSYELAGSDGNDLTVTNSAGGLVATDTLQFQVSAPFQSSRNNFNGSPVSTVFTTGDNADGTILRIGAQMFAGQVFFVLGRRHDTEGKLQLAPVQVRILVLP